MKFYAYILIFNILMLFVACSEVKREKVETDNSKLEKEALIRINKYLITKDGERISAYLKRRNWEMKISETGLWYMFYENGTGEKAKTGNVVTLDYTVELLDGTKCYDSDSIGVKHFRVGQGGVEQGLEEAILLMKKGDKARFILPPYLAHGLVGDGNKIPSRAIIIYDIELLEIKAE